MTVKGNVRPRCSNLPRWRDASGSESTMQASQSSAQRMIALTALMWLVMCCTGCPTPQIANRLRLKNLRPPPTSNIRKKVRWLRVTFYDLYLEEKRLQDGADRLRRLFRQFPVLARATHRQNLKAIQARRQEGLKLRNIEKFYLLMNLMIRGSIKIPSSTQSVGRPG